MHAKSTQTARNPKPLWQEFETASVDLYRLGAITACALGTVQRCHARRSLATETLRRLCHRALVHGERTPEDGGREEEEGGALCKNAGTVELFLRSNTKVEQLSDTR